MISWLVSKVGAAMQRALKQRGRARQQQDDDDNDDYYRPF
jgi:hypothetical protein